MKKKFLRILSVVMGAAISLGAVGLLAGCTSNEPEVRVVYSFNGKDYAVDYVLSRLDAPRTVQHFIELADGGYYDYDDEMDRGFVVHNFDREGGMYTGGYYLSGEELVEVDYTSRVKDLVGDKFTHSVWADQARTQPTYTVYGEFYNNGFRLTDERINHHTQGALVMYYTDKANAAVDVTVERIDQGKDNNGNLYDTRRYAPNSAQAMFYTYLGASADSTAEQSYCVFGMAKDFEGQLTNGLLKAIADYQASRAGDDEFNFTKEIADFTVNVHDFFETVRNADVRVTYDTPVEMPIVIRSVKVTKY